MDKFNMDFGAGGCPTQDRHGEGRDEGMASWEGDQENTVPRGKHDGDFIPRSTGQSKKTRGA